MKDIHSRLPIERRLGDWMRARLPFAVAEFVMFVLKQGWACLFAITMLVLLIGSKLVWQPEWALARYDFLVLAAIAIQAAFLWFRLESLDEAKVILIFHVSGTLMEIFKIHMGTWAYPEPGILKVMGVPLFSGFMYASVGSFMARVIRIFDMRFSPYPREALTWALGLAIYLNFFWHHFGPDARYVLMAGTLLIFGRTIIWFRISDRHYPMPLVVAAALTCFFMWGAENIGTLTGTWVYAGNKTFHWTSLAKAGSWYLLLYVSFVQVMLVYRDRMGSAPTPERNGNENQISPHHGPREGHRGLEEVLLRPAGPGRDAPQGSRRRQGNAGLSQ
jgi:uncharacterized membrane protein YoaT (DUF817 family)